MERANSSTLALLKYLCDDAECHLMIIATYRSDAVDDSHPLIQTLREIDNRAGPSNKHHTKQSVDFSTITSRAFEQTSVCSTTIDLAQLSHYDTAKILMDLLGMQRRY